MFARAKGEGWLWVKLGDRPSAAPGDRAVGLQTMASAPLGRSARSPSGAELRSPSGAEVIISSGKLGARAQSRASGNYYVLRC